VKYRRVLFSSPKGLEIFFRNQSQSLFQLDSIAGWDLSDSEHGVLARHDSRPDALLVPWAQVGCCDILTEEVKAKKAS
jgi:hypothetical protein